MSSSTPSRGAGRDDAVRRVRPATKAIGPVSPIGRERWDLWNLQALKPDATPTLLRALRRRHDRIARIERRVLREGRGDTAGLMRAARAFIDRRPELQGGLILSLHLGPYMLLPAAYLLSGRDPVILLDGPAHRRMRPRAEAEIRRLGLDGSIGWIPTDEAAFMVRLLRALRNGKPVIVFLDGNSGAGGMEATRDDGLRYRLPGRIVRLRTGLGRLISRTACPVHGLSVRWRENGTLDWRAWTPPPGMAARGPEAITRLIYTWMFAQAGDAPEQWSFWGILGRSSEVFRDRRADLPSTEVVRRRGRRFLASLRDAAAVTRVHLARRVEVWDGDLLVDLERHHFYAADGLRDESLDSLRWGCTPTLATLDAAFGRDWLERHLLRLHVLGLASLEPAAAG